MNYYLNIYYTVDKMLRSNGNCNEERNSRTKTDDELFSFLYKYDCDLLKEADQIISILKEKPSI